MMTRWRRSLEAGENICRDTLEDNEVHKNDLTLLASPLSPCRLSEESDLVAVTSEVLDVIFDPV